MHLYLDGMCPQVQCFTEYPLFQTPVRWALNARQTSYREPVKAGYILCGNILRRADAEHTVPAAKPTVDEVVLRSRSRLQS